MGLFQKASDLVVERGLRGAALHIGKRLVQELDRARPSNLLAGWQLAQKEAALDRTLGVKTSGRVSLSRVQVEGPHRRFGVNYRGTDPEEFDRAFAGLKIAPADFTFVDLGCGKGRALFFAEQLGFKRIVGVEFARELYDAARDNVARYCAARPKCAEFVLVNGDATQFTFPDEPLVVYMYNPFSGKVMAEVAARVQASYDAHPRPFYVVYTNPFELDTWSKLGFETVDTGALHVVMRPSSVRAGTVRSNVLGATG
jgi:SAM-dependent methyltransferase